MTEPATQPSTAPRHAARRWGLWAILALVLLGTAGLVRARIERERLQTQLLSLDANAVPADATLRRFAVAQAQPLYAANCAACHGADMKGNTALGAPNLTDRVWLYGSGSVFDIERTLLFGIRSGQSKSHNVTDMPAFGTMGTLSSAEINDVVQYLLQLNRRPYQGEAAANGKAVFYGKANCFDCHGSDARGNPDYGSTDLTANVWNSGGEPKQLYDAIYFGQHHTMPAWLGTLTLEQIRALAVYVYVASHPSE